MRRAGSEHRLARVGAGLSLRDVAAASGTSHQQLMRFERGELGRVSIEEVGAWCAVVLRWRTEVPLPLDRDLRAWDAEVRGSTPEPWRTRIEAETRVGDAQSPERRLRLKHRDDPDGHLILLLADTRTNRRAAVAMREGLGGLLPLQSRAILAALRAGRDPGGSGIVIL